MTGPSSHVFLTPLLLACLTATFCQGQDNVLSKEFRSSTVERASQVLIERYVFPETGSQAAERLRSENESGHFDQFTTLDSFAQAITDSVYAVTKDKHLTVSRRRSVALHSAHESQTAALLEQRRHYRQSNAGFETIQKMAGNVGYLKLTGFYGLDIGKPHADRAMASLSTSDAIIIDLRDNRGGRGEMADYLLSYFFEQTVETSKTTKRIGDQFVENIKRTQLMSPQNLLPEVPLYVLLSRDTISAAEGFSFPLKIFKRATFVGEVSAGAANPGDLIPLNEQLQFFVSDVSVTHPSNDSSWEGVGIIPDIECDPDEALDTALTSARRAAKEFNTLMESRASEAVGNLERATLAFNSESPTDVIVEAYRLCQQQGIFFSEWELNRLGYQHLGEQRRTKLGEAILQANSVLYPHSANVFDSYGDALFARGDLQKALINYRKAVEIGTSERHENLEQFIANVKRVEKLLSQNADQPGRNKRPM